MHKILVNSLYEETNKEIEQRKHINICLSRHFDIFSRIIYYITGRGYTHVSIGLEDDENTFYSFNGKGFRIEKPSKWRKRDNRVQTDIYQLTVSPETYENLKAYIEDVRNNQDRYGYSYLGLFLCLIRISYQPQHKFICSQFVAEALRRAGILEVTVSTSTFLPNSFSKAFENQALAKKVYC